MSRDGSRRGGGAGGSLRWVPLVGGILGALGGSSDANADEMVFSSFDVQTVFFISKSDNRNRVDYGIRLDARCVPTTGDPVFPYWREYESAPPLHVHGLGVFEFIAYGIADQRVTARSGTGATVSLSLRQFSQRPIEIFAAKQADGHCRAQAYTTIQGKRAELSYIHVKLITGGLAPQVDYVDVHGKDTRSGKDVEERLRP